MYLLREKRDTDEDTVDIYTIMTTFHPPNSTIFNVHNIRYRIRLYRVGIELQSVYLYCSHHYKVQEVHTVYSYIHR